MSEVIQLLLVAVSRAAVRCEININIRQVSCKLSELVMVYMIFEIKTK